MNDVNLVKAAEITPAEPASAPPPRETIGPFLTAKLGALRERLAGIKPRLLASGDAEAVHDLRVGLRRARTVLAVGRPVFGRHYADQVRAAFREVHQATGALRDEEVLLELIAALDAGPEWPEVHAWLDVRRRRERSLRARLRRMVQAGALDSGLRLLDALLLFQVKPSRDRRLTKFARRAIDEAKRKVERRSTGDAARAPRSLQGPALHRGDLRRGARDGRSGGRGRAKCVALSELARKSPRRRGRRRRRPALARSLRRDARHALAPARALPRDTTSGL